MSILIKGMKMPTSCLSCDFCNPFTDTPYCRRLMKITPISTRLDDCPLVELPPHGRLIDADALIVDLMDRGVEGLQTDDWYEIRQAVDDAPTIIEEEV